MASDQGWQEKAKLKRESILAALPSQYLIDSSKYASEVDVTGSVIRDLLSARELEITETTAEQIAKKTSSGEWTAVEVINAFIHRASLAHQLRPCLLEVFFEAAIEDANRLDAFYSEHKRPIGPLHGLPVSLKDQCHVKGVETSMGYIGWIGTFEGKKDTGKEKVFESEIVKELRNLGAVLFCKTSVPYTLMIGETFNNIIGYTRNPKNINLSAGGSSGGEGALISMRGSPLGFGTDIGGSIRIPSVFNGLCGLRPSTGRVPYEGMANSMDGQNNIRSVVGPLSTSVASLRLVMSAIASQQPWLHDPLVHQVPWRTEHEREVQDIIASTSSKLVFGVLKNDGHTIPHPPVRRAIDMVVKAVEDAGHKVIEWSPPSHDRAMKIFMKVIAIDGGEDCSAAFNLSGEDVSPAITHYYSKPIPQLKGSEIFALNVAQREYQKEYMDYWTSTKELTGSGRPVDAFIMLAPFAAGVPLISQTYHYSAIINFLDYPSCGLPVTQVDKKVDLVDIDFKPLNDDDEKNHGYYDPDIYDGAHVGVQIVGRRMGDERLLAIAAEVERALDELK